MSRSPTVVADDLATVAAAAGCALDERAVGELQAFEVLLTRWNRSFNLTALRAADQVRHGHVLDCLAVVAPLRRWAAGRALRILDVGSGGGLPGVVLAVVEPRWQVVCVDAVAKKAAFVRQVSAELRRPNLRAEHVRVEALQPHGGFDLVTARAFASLADLVRLTRPLLAPGGVWMAMKGRRPGDEIADLPADVEAFHVEPLIVPGLDAERCLVWMRAR